MTITIATDGASKSNQTPENRRAGIGFVVQIDGETVYEEGQWLGAGEEYTCNVAEYEAAIVACEWLESSECPNSDRIRFLTDSELMVKQMTGEYSVNDEKLIPRHGELTERLEKFKEAEIYHDSDDKNELLSQADTLAKKGAEQDR
jgi:ribonuclease HI